jgi:hypothetical protein
MAPRIIFLACLFGCLQGPCQEKRDCNTISENMGYSIRSVVVKGRWVPSDLKKQIAATVGEGQPLRQSNISAGKAILVNAIDQSETSFPIRLIGSTSVLYVGVDICDVSDADHPKMVDVTLKPYYVRIDLYNLNHNVLPIPRSPYPSFYKQVPGALLALSPTVYFYTDQVTGSSIGLQTATDLLQLSSLKKQESRKKLFLDLDLQGQKSIDKPFYNWGASLGLGRKNYTDSAISWELGASYRQEQSPITGGNNRKMALNVYAGIQGALKSALFRKYALGVGYITGNDSSNYKDVPQATIHGNGFASELMSEGRIGEGLLRTGIWFDDHFPEESSGLSDYQRLSGKIGYGVVLGKGHTNVDLESTIGYGCSFGFLPYYDRYYAGNSHWNFLYASFSSPSSSLLPDGAVLRGLGNHQGGVVLPGGGVSGASSFWHWNLSFSIPIARWSKPLIPDIDISDQPKITLRKALKGQVETAKNFIAQDLVDNHSYPAGDETDAYAERIVSRDIRPTLDYLADRANIYAVKPVVLFDVAGLHLRDAGSTTFMSVGGGLQLTVVTATLQAGYAYTLHPSYYKGKGNFLIRLIMQNFF